MKTHTIRWNSDKSLRIVKFTKSFERLLVKAHPQAIRVFLTELAKNLAQMTGRKHIFDHDQQERISKYLEADLVKASGGWVGKAERTFAQIIADRWVQNGVRLMDTSLPDAIDCLHYIYTRLLPIKECEIENSDSE
jgi:hypothetical protein